MIDWSLYQVFLAVAETGSLTKAARKLGLSQPTIGRQIAALEQASGVKLFQRQPRGLTLTPAGMAIREAASAMDEAALAVQRRIEQGGRDLLGEVRVSATEGLGIHWLPARFARMRGLLPGIDVSVIVNNSAVDLLRREADIALRLFRPAQKQLHAERKGQIAVGLYASRDYLQRRREPRTEARLSEHDFIGFADGAAAVPQVQWLNHATRGARIVYRANSLLGQHEAVRHGLGLGLLSCFLADLDPELVRVLPEINIFLDVWLVVHDDLRQVPRIGAVYDFLGAELEADQAALAASGI